MLFWCRERTRVIQIPRIGAGAGGLGARPPARRGLVPGPGRPHLTLSHPRFLSVGPGLGGGGGPAGVYAPPTPRAGERHCGQHRSLQVPRRASRPRTPSLGGRLPFLCHTLVFEHLHTLMWDPVSGSVNKVSFDTALSESTVSGRFRAVWAELRGHNRDPTALYRKFAHPALASLPGDLETALTARPRGAQCSKAAPLPRSPSSLLGAPCFFLRCSEPASRVPGLSPAAHPV